MNTSTDHGSIKSTDSKKKLSKKLSNTKIINGICNTAFTLEEKLQSKGYSNFQNSEDAKSSDEDVTNNSTINSTIDSSNMDLKHDTNLFDEPNQDNQCPASATKQDQNFNDCDQFINQSDQFVKTECDICFAESKDSKRMNSDIRAAVQNLNQNLSCGLNLLSSTNKCPKCNTLPDYVQQLSVESSDHLKEHHRNIQNGLNRQNSIVIANEHGVEIPDTTISNDISRPNKLWSALKGVFLAFLSSIFFSLTAVIVKYVKEIDAGQMAVYRFCGMLLFVFPIVTDRKQGIFGPSKLRHWILLRGLAGASSLYLRYSALHYLPMSNATVSLLSF